LILLMLSWLSKKAINDILEVTIALLLDYKQQQQSLLVHAAVG